MRKPLLRCIHDTNGSISKSRLDTFLQAYILCIRSSFKTAYEEDDILDAFATFILGEFHKIHIQSAVSKSEAVLLTYYVIVYIV